MTTQTNILRKTASSLGFIIIALLISYNVNAQKSLYSYDIKKSTSELIKRSSEEIANAFFSKNEKIIEEEVSFEDWMIDLEKFAKNIDSLSKNNKTNEMSLSKEELEEMETLNEEVELDDWMIEASWNYISSDSTDEKSVEIEDWMANINEW